MAREKGPALKSNKTKPKDSGSSPSQSDRAKQVLKIICSFGKMWLIWESKVWEGQKNKNVLKLGSRLGKPTTLVVFTNRNEAGTEEPSEKSIEIHRELQRYRMSCPKIWVPQKATKMYRIWWGHQGNAKRIQTVFPPAWQKTVQKMMDAKDLSFTWGCLKKKLS